VKLPEQEMVRVRPTIWTLCLVFVVAGITLGQQSPLTPTTAALRLSSNKDSYDYWRATQTVALSYWRHGDYKSAFAQIDNLAPSEQERQFLNFISLAIKSRQPEPARSALDRALKLVTSGDEDAHDTAFIRDFARFAVEVDDLDLASRFTEALDEGSALRAFALVSLAEARAKRGEKDKAISLLDQAIKQVDSFDDGERDELIDLYADGVKVFINLDEKERANDLASRANELFLSQEKPSWQDRSQVALSFARLGDSQRAMLLLESLDDDDKVSSLVSLADVFQTRGDETAALSSLLQARAVLESTSDDDYSRSIALNHLAMGYLKVGKPDEAFEVMRGITDPFHLADTATEVASSFFARGRRQDAGATLDFARSHLGKIVSEKSEDIPGYASGSKAQTKSHGLTDLGEKYLEFGELRGAEAAAKAIDHPQYRASLLARVAAAYAKEGDKPKAKSLLALASRLSSNAEEYNHDTPREYALFRIADAYADAGLKQESANAIMRLLRELRDGDHDALTIDCLIEVGLMADTKGVPIDRGIQTVLKQVIKKAVDN